LKKYLSYLGTFRGSSEGASHWLRRAALEVTLLTMQWKWTFTKRFFLSTLQRKCPMLRWHSQKNALLAAIARYISITQFTQYAIADFQRRPFLFKLSIAMICKKRSIGLPCSSTKPQIMTLFYLASRAHPADIFKRN